MFRELLSYEDAVWAISCHVSKRERVFRRPLAEAFGWVLAETIVAAEPNPRFDNSAVDGYAVGSEAPAGSRLPVESVVAAGGPASHPIAEGSAIRILTGAPIPIGTFGIVMQEDVDIEQAAIVLKAAVEAGQYVRFAGSDFDAGYELANVGDVIDAAVAAQIAFAGVTDPLVYEKPKVTVLTTGDELVDIAQMPSGSQIRDTNSIMLQLQVADTIGVSPDAVRVADDREALKYELVEAASKSDLLVVAGGASVGDRDYLAGIVEEVGEIVFHGASIRPGKPILFGKVGASLLFGLPGNPASAFVCFEIFVRSALHRLAGWSDPQLSWVETTTGFAHKACGREDFARVQLEDGRIYPVGQQGSFGIQSLVRADGLARFSGDRDTGEGETCLVRWLR